MFSPYEAAYIEIHVIKNIMHTENRKCTCHLDNLGASQIQVSYLITPQCPVISFRVQFKQMKVDFCYGLKWSHVHNVFRRYLFQFVSFHEKTR